MIKTVVFDFGGVIFSEGSGPAIKEISSKYNIPEDKVREVVYGELGIIYRLGIIEEEEFWEFGKKIMNTNTPSKELAEIWHSNYKLNEGTLNLIKKLKDAGYELLYLSDNINERIKFLDSKYNVLHNFKDGVFSHVVKTRKPYKKIYELVLEKTSNKPEECVFIDDTKELLEPAKKMGMKTINFNTHEQVEKELRDLGLNF